jgi:hypothetical protein
VVVPYFNRNYRHFCSHKHTPSSGRVAYPGIVRRGHCIYFAHPVFTQYQENAPLWCKTLVKNALGILLPEPYVRTNGPSSLMVTLNAQLAECRWVLHLLHYIPEHRGQKIDIVEDVICLYDLRISVRPKGRVRQIRCVPQDEPLTWKINQGRVEFSLPRLEGHQMIDIAYAEDERV